MMPENRTLFSKKKALSIVLVVALILLFLIFLRSFFPAPVKLDLSSPQGRQTFLSELGWEIDLDSESFRTVTVPDKLEGIMLQYNKMQLAQGYDLSKHLGESCQQYTYVLTNYTDSEATVLVTLYIQGNEVIAGDIHTTASNGFMHGLHRNSGA